MEKLNNRITKNVIMIVLISGLTVGMLFTSGIVGRHDKMQGPPQMSGQQNGKQGGQQGGKMQGPPDMQQGQNGGTQNGQNGQNGGQQTPPDGDSGSQNSQQTPPDGNSGGQSGQQTPPEQPSDNSSNQQGGNSGSQQTGNTDDQQIQTTSQQNGQSSDQQIETTDQQDGTTDQQTAGQPGGQNGQQMTPPDQQNGQQMGPQNGRSHRGGVSTGMKVLAGFEAFGIAALAAYLIMSEFNKKSFKETMPDKKKATAFAAAIVIAGSGLTAAAVLIPGRNGCMKNGMPQQMEQGQNGQQNQPQSSSQVEAKGAETVDGKEQTLNDSYESTSENENVILVTNGGTLTSDGATVNKKSGDGSDTDSCDFNGVNAGILVNEDSSANIKNATIKTAATMSTGSKSKITIRDSTVTTTGERSCRGLDATNGGTIVADNVKIKTQGGSCAALATDRGEGTVTVTNSELETNGAGSPVIYSTGNISIDKTTGTANGSQITVVEGKNSATITASKVTASAAGNRGDVDVCGVMLYQSMSGDADEGTANFTTEKSTLSIDKKSDYYKTAPMFFVTNTSAKINLTDTRLNFGSGVLLSVKGTDEWGTSGSNGGTVELTAKDQTLEGDVEADKISEVTISLSDGSSYEGAINKDNTAKSVTLKLSKDSRVKLTGDTYVTSLEDEDSDYSNIDFNGHKLYVNGKAVN